MPFEIKMSTEAAKMCFHSMILSYFKVLTSWSQAGLSARKLLEVCIFFNTVF